MCDVQKNGPTSLAGKNDQKYRLIFPGVRKAKKRMDKKCRDLIKFLAFAGQLQLYPPCFQLLCH